MKNKKLIISVLFSIIAISIYSQQFIEQTGIAITGVNQGSAAWGDYNNDGYPDILMTGWSGSESVTKIYRNNGDNTFTEQTAIVLRGVFLSSVAWGDYDNDGDLDILLTGTTTGVTSGAISKIYRNTNGTFTDISAGLPGVYFGNVSWCDYDRDGRLDILLTGMSDSAERICKLFRNNGNGSFKEVIGTPFIGVQYSSAAWGDYDNDGYPDLLVTGQNAVQEKDTRIYHNNGNGTFTELTNLTLKTVYNSSVAWGDYNSDGLLDILYSGEDLNYKSITGVYKNMGNNSFIDQNLPALTGVKKGSVAWGDYNNDGKLDIFLSGRSNTARISKIYSNCTDSTFCNTNESLTGLIDCSISLADYDNDGDLDLFMMGMDPLGNLVSKIYRNDCAIINNTPAAPGNVTYITTGTTSLISWDKVTSDETSYKSISYNVRIGRTAGNSAFVASNSGSTGIRRIASLGNAYLENSFIFKNLRWDTTYYVSVQAIDNCYKGSSFTGITNMKITPVQPSGLFASYITTTSILVKWIRGNGDKCIVFAREGSSGSASPVNNTTYYANPVFKEGSPLGSDWYCIYKGEADSVLLSGLETQKDYSIHVIEFQGEIGSELYATPLNENLGVFSTGLFTNQALASMEGLRRSSVSWGDFNNDHYLDALISGQNLAGLGTTKIYQNNANNTFTELPGVTIPGVYNGSVSWGDYNNDGFLDILIIGYNDDLGPISRIYKNNGDKTFTEQTGIVLAGVYNSSAVWGDFDNDGDLDIIIAGLNSNNVLSTKIYRNDGNNHFTEQTGISLPGIQNGSIALGDYDNNGFLDILITGFIANNGRISKIFRNTGNNNFQEQTSISLPGASLSSGAWGDYDNDGNLDIILAGATGDYPNFNQFTRVYHNNGNNTFTELLNTKIVGISQGSLAWGDYNNDGFLDILLTGYTGSSYIFKVYQNNGNQTFTDNPFVQLPGAIACDVKWADYDNDGDLDILMSGYTGALLSRVYKNNTFMIAGNIKPNLKPETPTGLASAITPGNVKLFWNLITTDETPVMNMSYNVRCKLGNSGNWFYSPQSLENGSRNLASLGNVQLNKSFFIKNPGSGKYYWQVQAVDQGFQGSTWSPVDSFLIKNTQAYFSSDTVCLKIPTHFTDQSIVTDGIASWKWDFKDGTISVIQNPVHSYASAGTFSVKLLVTSSTGDKDSLIQNVIVKNRPSTQFTAPNVCVGIATPINNITSLNGLTISSWLWKFGDGQSSSSEQPGNHTFSLKGTYKTMLKAISTNSCSDSITRDVIIAGLPGTSISADKKLVFCAGDTLTLSAEKDPLYTYQWTMDNTNYPGATQSSLKIFENSAAYFAKITNTLAPNCITNSESKTITIKPTPSKPAISSDNYKTGDCISDSPIKLKVSQSVNDYNYVWFRNGTPINNAVLPYIEDFLDQGDYIVAAELNGCLVNSDKFSVNYTGAPEKPKIFAQGPNKWYLATNSLTAKEYRWYFNDKLIDGALKYYYVADQKLGVYRVSVGDSKGCFTRSDSLKIPTDKYSPAAKSLTVGNPFAGLKIYPNPSPGIFNLEMDNEILGTLNIIIINHGGKEILKIKFEKTTTYFSSQIDLSGQIKGVYMVNIRLDKYFTTNQIIIE